MSPEAKQLAEYLEQVADFLEFCGYTERPAAPLVIEKVINGCRFRVLTEAYAGALRCRARALLKSARRFGDGTTNPAEGLPSTLGPRNPRNVRRPRTYNKGTAQLFLDDGEKDNWRAYRELFNA